MQNALSLCGTQPELALEQADAILEAVPGHPHAQLVRGRALRLAGRPVEAGSVLARLAETQPTAPSVFVELGEAELAAGHAGAAETAFRMCLALSPDHGGAWQGLAAALSAQDRQTEALQAELTAIRLATQDPELRDAALALLDERLADAEAILKRRLRRNPIDPPALRMLAEVAGRLGRLRDAAALLQDCLDQSPNFLPARALLARVLHRMTRFAEALAQADLLLRAEPHNPNHQLLRAAALIGLGEFDAGIAAYEAVLATHPRQPKGWMSLGHALKTVGRTEAAIAAYRTALGQAPGLGEVWWSLANLKTFRFDAGDRAAMVRALRAASGSEDDCLHLHFALAKAMEDAGEDAEAWTHYSRGNAIRAAQLRHNPDETSRAVDRAIATWTPALLGRRDGCPAGDPIFIVGLPRAGSTLIEQVLASHSLVEGTAELPDVPIIAARLGGKADRYPEALAEVGESELRALGAEYLERAGAQRKSDKAYFIDKLPNNWLHVGLIRLMLPNARIIDARRHPMSACVAAFRQNFARGQAFSYDLAHLGQYYRDYVRLMAHVDRVAPGAVIRIHYEDMVTKTEATIRGLLAALDLPFESDCLQYWRTERAIRTPSAEQVRRPVFTEGLEYWRRHEGELAPLKAALGSVLDAWPEVPADILDCDPDTVPVLEGNCV